VSDTSLLINRFIDETILSAYENRDHRLDPGRFVLESAHREEQLLW
jgi:hypothetical protein